MWYFIIISGLVLGSDKYGKREAGGGCELVSLGGGWGTCAFGLFVRRCIFSFRVFFTRTFFFWIFVFGELEALCLRFLF